MNTIEPSSYSDFLVGSYIERTDDFQDVLKKDARLDVISYLSNYANGFIGWYDFKKNSKILQIGSCFGAYSELLSKKADLLYILEADAYRFYCTKKRLAHLDNVIVLNGDLSTLDETTFNLFFDYVVVSLDGNVDSIKKREDYVLLLKRIKYVLKLTGTLLFTIPNRFGIKYLCGEPDEKSGIPFSGITDDDSSLLRLSRACVKELFEESPFKNFKFYYPLPDVRYSRFIYSDLNHPDEDLFDRLYVFIKSKYSMILDRYPFYREAVKNKVIDFFVNDFIVEASDELLSDVIYSSISCERTDERACSTVIYNNGLVKKIPLNPQKYNYSELLDNMFQLSQKGLSVVDVKKSDECIEMPFVSHPTLSKYLQQKCDLTRNELIKIEDELWSCILRSSDHVESSLNCFKKYNSTVDFGIILKKASIEMIPVNCFYINGELQFFDQEFSMENCPAGFVMFRALNDIDKFVPKSRSVFPLSEAKKRFGLETIWEYFLQEESCFEYDLGNLDLYRWGHTLVYPYLDEMWKNRKLLSIKSKRSVGKLYDPASGRKLVVWGTGKRCSRFMNMYGKTYCPAFFVDNNSEKWGSLFYGIEIRNPMDILNDIHGSYYVLIAVNDFEPIQMQLESMNIGSDSYAVFNPNEQFVQIDSFLNLPELKTRKMFVFGSGEFARKFLAFYRKDYNIACVLDNNEDKWNEKFFDIPIASPDFLANEVKDAFNVVICVKNYFEIQKQLCDLGVKSIGLYDAHRIYPGRQTLVPQLEKQSQITGIKKKYHIGYIAGVFDLYHLGHLNMFKRAKEQCDYLIVGVTSDKYVTELKKKQPFIPFEERIEMIRSCKYVDEAVEIPFEYGGTVEAFQKYHFDVQFSGSDYIDNPWWLEQQAYLRSHGADLVFFPYTQQTSSTKIKALINKELEGKQMPSEPVQPKIYKLGFALSSLAHANEESANQMRPFAEQCEKFVIGIPSDYVMARIFGGGMNGYNADAVAAWWKNLGFVSDVLVLDKLELSYQSAYERLHFDACFYGSEYGNQFEIDSRFFADNNVSFINTAPQKRIIHGEGDSLILALQNIRKDQKVVLFGTGLYFDLFVQNYSAYHKIEYAVDNDESKWNTKKNNVCIKNPEVLKQENSEDVLVVICARNYSEIKDQIKSYGDFNTRTLIYNNQIALLEEYYLSCRAEEAYIKQAQTGLMGLLKEFDRVCKKYNLKYYIICGSLIGVVRHKGFIPWDDDMDLAMTWEDYQKLRKVAKKEWENSNYHLLHYTGLGNGAFLDFMPRLVYMEEYFPTKVYDKVTGKCNPKFEHKMFIDIYPMMNASSNNRKHNFYMNMMKGVYNLCMGHRACVDYGEYSRMPQKTVRLMKFINTCGKFLPLWFLTSWYTGLANYAKHEKCDEYFMPSCAITCIERKFKKEFFNEGVYLPFNDMQVMVPGDYAGLLEAMGYHGYMNYPPLHIRKPSHYFNSDIEIW